MYVGRIRPRSTTTAEVEASSLADIQATLAELAPAGHELVAAPVQMVTGSAVLKAVGTFSRRDDAQDIEADDREALFAKVPEGWQLLSVRKL
jgi:hypothetical protein